MKYKITTVDGQERTHDLNENAEDTLFYQLSNPDIWPCVSIKDEFGFLTVYNRRNIVSVSSLEPVTRQIRAVMQIRGMM